MDLTLLLSLGLFHLTHTPNLLLLLLWFYWTISIFIVHIIHSHTTDLSLSSFSWKSKWFRMHDIDTHTRTIQTQNTTRQRANTQTKKNTILKIKSKVGDFFVSNSFLDCTYPQNSWKQHDTTTLRSRSTHIYTPAVITIILRINK